MPDENGDAPRVRVSVVICVFNGARTIMDQLRALGNQEKTVTFEILVVDNASTDSTVKVVNDWMASGIGNATSARIIDASARAGIGFARNRGAESARGEILAFCDADDIVLPTWISAIDSVIGTGNRAATGVALEVSPDAVFDMNAVRHAHTVESVGFVSAPSDHTEPIRYGWGGNLALTRAAFFSVGGFDESLPPYGCEDVELGIRLSAGGIELLVAPGMDFLCRVTTGARSRIRRNYRSGIAQACVWDRHPEVYGRMPSLVSLACLIFIDPIRAFLRRRGTSKDRTLTGLMMLGLRAGSFVGALRWVKSGRLGKPRLLPSPGSNTTTSKPMADQKRMCTCPD